MKSGPQPRPEMTHSMLNSPTLKRYQEPGGHLLLLSVPSLKIQGWERKWGSKISRLRFWSKINHSGHPQAPDEMKPTPFFKNKGVFLPSSPLAGPLPHTATKRGGFIPPSSPLASPLPHCRKRGASIPACRPTLPLQKKGGVPSPLPVPSSTAKKKKRKKEKEKRKEKKGEGSDKESTNGPASGRDQSRASDAAAGAQKPPQARRSSFHRELSESTDW